MLRIFLLVSFIFLACGDDSETITENRIFNISIIQLSADGESQLCDHVRTTTSQAAACDLIRDFIEKGDCAPCSFQQFELLDCGQIDYEEPNGITNCRVSSQYESSSSTSSSNSGFTL